jgi:trimeric autotransporter adhesin
MKRSYIGLALGALLATGAALTLPSCGHQQKLVSITVSPAAPTFLAPNAVPTTLTAYGTYIHPPSTQDITAQVTWATNVPSMLTLSTISGAEQVAPNGICGIADISATAPEGTGGSNNIIVGYSTATIDGVGPNCPGNQTGAEIVVTPAGTGVGTVSSSPTGISCPGTACGALFTAGDTVVLTAAAGANSTFTGWQQCPTVNSNQCTVTADGFLNIIATFTQN